MSWILAFVLLLAACGASHAAAAVTTTPATTTTATAPILGRGNVEALADQLIPRQLLDSHVPGAAFIFVKDGEVLFAKGYGLANVDETRAFSPERTVFPVGSLSKPVTATAVMQLYERGRLKLDADINVYLRTMQLETIGGRPITMHDLLTHSAGFDPVYVDIATREPESVQSLESYLPTHVPPRAMPGVISNYSNYGYSLAGYIVEEVSGQPFERYMSGHVFEPLHMYDSTFASAEVPSASAAHGYDWHGRGFVEVPPLYPHETPAAGMSSTAADMAKFMIAMLQRGQYRTTHILYPGTADTMLRTQFTHHPALPGWTYGFSEGDANGRRALEHGGMWNGFTCKMLLIPQENAGFFIVYNRFDPALRDGITRPLLDRLFPANPRRPASAATVPTLTFGPGIDIEKLSGSYRSAWYAHGTIEKLRTLWKPQNVVRAESDGTITLIEPDSGETHFIAVGPLLFRSMDHQRHIAFRADEHGTVTHLLVGIEAFERARWWELSSVHVALFAAFVLIFGMSMTFSSWRWMRARRRGERGGRVRLAIAVCSGLNLAFLAGFAFMLLHADNRDLVYGISPPRAALLHLPMAAVAVTALVIVLSAVEWFAGMAMPRWRRWRHTIFSLAAVAFVPFLAYWNLVRF